MKPIKKIIIIAACCILPVIAVRAQSDSLQKLNNRVENLESAQKNKEDALENKFTKLEQDLSWELSTTRWIALIAGSITIIGLIGVWYKGKKYINEKLKEKFDKIISDKESDIIAIVNKHDEEKQLVQHKKILVLTSQSGSEDFVRRFFKAMKFPIDNITYKKVSEYNNFGKFDVIVANNEKGDFDLSLIQEFFEKSDKSTAVFYFNETKTNYLPSEQVADRLNFANSKLQIYGNLINLLRYQDVLKS